MRVIFFIFFFKQKTAYEMRISDWSSDVCSSDLVVLGLIMLLRGFADALMMRTQQAIAFGESAGYLPPHHYDQIFTAHGVIMIFFVAMPQIGRASCRERVCQYV